MADQMEKRNKPRIQVKWPITIYTKKGPVKGESRNITSAGIFIHCEEELRLNEVCRMRIRPPQKQSVEVEGKLIWSNLDGLDSAGPYSGMGFSFVKCSVEGQRLLDEVISRHLEKWEDEERKEGISDDYEI
ncbi:MAG: PilZ domain-containing protein [Desulfobacteraceae bacterium]